jgi:predicted GTPase
VAQIARYESRSWPTGAGYLAAVEAATSEIVDPRPSAVGHIAAAFQQFPHIGNKVLPALG